jgi:hypothetical protein
MKTKRLRFLSLALCLVMLLGILPVGAMAATSSNSIYFGNTRVYDDSSIQINISDYLYNNKLYLDDLADEFDGGSNVYDIGVTFYSNAKYTSKITSTTYDYTSNDNIYCILDIEYDTSVSGSYYDTYYVELYWDTDEYSMNVTLDRTNYLDANDFYGSSKWKTTYDIKISAPRYGSIYDSSTKNDAEISYTGYYYLSDLEDLYYYCSSSDAKKATYDYADFTIYNGNTVIVTGTMYFNFGSSSSSTTSKEKDFYLAVTAKSDTYFSTSLFENPGGYTYDLSDYSASKVEFIVESIPVYGDLYNGNTQLTKNDSVYLSKISSVSYYSTSSSKTDSITFSLYDTKSGSYIVQKATLYFLYGQDEAKSFTVNYTSGKVYNFTLKDFTDNFTTSNTSGSLKYIKITTLPAYGTLKLGSTTVKKNDVIEASKLATLLYEPLEGYTKDAFGYTASSTGTLYSTEAAVTLSSAYTPTDYTVSTSGSVTTVTYSTVSPSSSTVTKTLSSDDVTYLVSKINSNGGTLVVNIPFSGSTTGVGRALSIDKSLFTGTNLAAFTRIILVDTTSSGNSIYLTVPTAGVATLYNTYSGNFTMTLSPTTLADDDKSAAAASVGITRDVDMTIGTINVDPAGAELSIPYNTTNDHYASVIMLRTGYQSYEPVLDSTWSDTMPYLSSDARPYVTCSVQSNKIYLSTVNSTTYTDMASTHWGYNYIRFLSARGIMSGYGGTDAGKVKPDGNVTRAEFIKMLVCALGLYNANANTTYTDVTGNAAWAASYIGSAQSAGIVKDSGTSFRPTEAITREEMALYAYRAASAAGITLSKSTAAITFNDASQISTTEMATAITAMQQAGIISGEATNGVATGNFNPSGVTTRAAAAKIISMLMAPDAITAASQVSVSAQTNSVG